MRNLFGSAAPRLAGKRLYCIDAWQAFPQHEYQGVANVPQAEHDQHFAQTQTLLQPFGRRVHILRKRSEIAAQHFADGQLDFVYLDPQHHFFAVHADLKTWSRKVRPGGILAGHDYLDGENAAGLFGVKSAVDEFAAQSGLRFVVTHEAQWPTWNAFD